MGSLCNPAVLQPPAVVGAGRFAAPPTQRFAVLGVLAFFAAFLLALASPASLAADRDVEIAGIDTTRFEGKAGFTGTVKVTRQKPIDGLLLTLEFFDAQGVLLTIQKEAIESKQLNAGDEVPFDLGGHDVPRAVSFRVVMYDSKKTPLTVTGGGPHPF